MEGIDNTIHLFFDSVKRRNKSTIGPMVINYLKEHQNGLYNYLLKIGKEDKMTYEDAGKMVTDNINNHFKVGYKLVWNDSLNQCMVDYDIVRVLGEYVGYSKWADIPMKDIKKCYRDFNKDFKLPEWDIQQERF